MPVLERRCRQAIVRRTTCYNRAMTDALTTTNTVIEIPLGSIRAGNNDRKTFADEALAELAESIRRNGLAQPITVRPAGHGEYEIIAGERRFRAHQLIEAATIRCLVVDYDDEQASTIMLLENVNRVDLTPVEEAAAYQARIDRFGHTPEQVAETVGKTPSYVRSRLALLTLVPEAQHLVSVGSMWLSNARDLVSLDRDRQRVACKVWVSTPDLTIEGWNNLIARLREEQARDAQMGFGFELATYVATVKETNGRRPGTKQLVQMLEKLRAGNADEALLAEVDAAITSWNGFYARGDKDAPERRRTKAKKKATDA